MPRSFVKGEMKKRVWGMACWFSVHTSPDIHNALQFQRGVGPAHESQVYPHFPCLRVRWGMEVHRLTLAPFEHVFAQHRVLSINSRKILQSICWILVVFNKTFPICGKKFQSKANYARYCHARREALYSSY